MRSRLTLSSGAVLVALALASCASSSPRGTAVSAGATPGKGTATTVGGPPLSVLPPPYTGPPPSRAVGIQNIAQAPFSQQDFAVHNEYFGAFGSGQWVEIYAGQKMQGPAAPPLGGGLRIYVEPADLNSTTGPTYLGEFLAPNAPSWVKIVAAQENDVTLQRADGTTVHFDLQRHTFSG